MITRLNATDRAGMRAAYEAWITGIAREIGPRALIEAEATVDMGVEMLPDWNVEAWMTVAGRKLVVTVPVIALEDGIGGTVQ